LIVLHFLRNSAVCEYLSIPIRRKEMNITKTTFNDGIGSRGRQHRNFLAARLEGGTQIIIEFQGKTIPGVARVRSTQYTKNGKWSHNTWDLELTEGVIAFTVSQSWGTGQWLDAQTWAEAVTEFSQGLPLEAEAVERFLRSSWTGVAERLDKAELAFAQPAGPALEKLLAAQEALAAAQKDMAAVAIEVSALERAEAIRLEAEAVVERAAQARVALKGRKLSLDELKALVE
jgi:hypothetical protein